MCLRVLSSGGAPVRGRPESTKYIGSALQLLGSKWNHAVLAACCDSRALGFQPNPKAAASGAAVMRQFAQALHKRRCKPLEHPAQITATDY